MSDVDNSSQTSLNIRPIDIKNGSNKINIEGTWGLPLCDVYKLALSFYKEKEGKAVQLCYEDKLQLVAFAQQVSHGPLANSNVPPVGALDVVGRDRRLAWQKLADLSADQARTGFVSLLSRRCPLFETYIEAHRRDNEEQQKKAQENAIRELEKRKQKEIEEKIEKEKETQIIQEEIARRKVKQALNEQTYDQFCIYAEQQFPGDPERQGDLVKQLQEQHYLQYMQQLQATVVSPRPNDSQVQSTTEVTTDEENLAEESLGTSLIEDNRIAEANMWTSPNVQEFKDTVSKGDGDGFLRVGHGERVIVRVPTRNDAKRLFWEFATDHYDIGFGVFFEWGTPNTDQVLVHVSGSEDEEEEDDEEDYDEIDFYESNNDLETGSVLHSMSQRQRNSQINQPILTEIVPVYRRDSHIEVYAGTHIIPAQGCYLLRFDNSYSLWRSKTLYYRVYYTNEE